jgi:hypothetical protein
MRIREFSFLKEREDFDWQKDMAGQESRYDKL